MKTKIVSLTTVIFLFVVAYLLDSLVGWTAGMVKETWNFQLLQWVKIGSYLIFAGIIVTIEYLIVKQKVGSRLSPYIFLVSGLVVLLIASPLFVSTFKHILFLGPMVTQASVFVVAIGFIGLLEASETGG